MRTTVVLNEQLMKKLKLEAAKNNCSIKSIIEQALIVHFNKGNSNKQKKYKLDWSADSGKILPGVELDDRNTLFDLMDES